MLLSSFLDRLVKIIQKLSHPKILAVLALFFIMVIFTNGISLVPPEQYQRLSQNPMVARTDIDNQNYWQETVLLPVLAFYSHLNSRLAFNVLCFFFIVVAYFLFAQLTFRREGSTAALIFTTILITSSLTTVLLAWLGTPDSLTFALTVPFLFINSGFAIFFLSILGAMNHMAFTIAAIEILILRWIAKDKIKVSHLLTMILGGTIGYVLVKAFLLLNEIHVLSRFEYTLSKNLIYWIVLNTKNFPMAFFSLFNIQWLILPVCLIMFYKMDKKYYSSLLAILLFNYGVTFISEDTTRIFSLLSLGVLLECVFHSYRLALNKKDEDPTYLQQLMHALIVIGMISFIVPRYYSWIGEIHTTSFLVFMRQVIP